MMARLYDRLQRALTHRRFAWFLAAMAALMTLPELGTGYLVDDYSHRYFAQGNTFPGGPRGVWDLYRFADGGAGLQKNIQSGIFPWYSDSHLKLAFLRPVTSLLRVAEEVAFGERAFLCHAVTVVLFIATSLAVLKLYRLWLGGAAASLAALLFTIDDAHSSTLTWIAARHSLVGTLFLALALGAHSSARARNQTSLASGALFLLALLSSESALSGLAFFAAMAVFDDPRAPSQRLRALLPVGAATMLWSVIYTYYGYGSQGSAFYIDPMRSPVRFLTGALSRGPVLALAQLFVPPAEVASLSPSIALPLAVFGAVFFVVFAALSVWRLPNRPLVASLLVGFVLSLIPACGTNFDDRLIMVPGIAAMALLALWARHLRSQPRPSLLLRAAAIVGFMVHVVLALALLPIRSLGMASALGGVVDHGSASLPHDSNIERQETFALSSSDSLLPASMILERVLTGAPGPRVVHLLGPSPASDITVKRLGPSVIELTSDGGMFHDPFIAALRPTMFTLGETVTTAFMKAEVLAVRDGGFPTSIRYTFFRQTMDDGQMRFIAWKNHRFEEVALPPPGSTLILPSVDFEKELAVGR